jgi:hypothetical protein
MMRLHNIFIPYYLIVGGLPGIVNGALPRFLINTMQYNIFHAMVFHTFPQIPQCRGGLHVIFGISPEYIR